MPIVSVAIELTARNFSRVITAEEFLTPLNIQPGEVEDAWVNKPPWGSSAVRISSCRNTSKTVMIDSEALFDAWAAETFRMAINFLNRRQSEVFACISSSGLFLRLEVEIVEFGAVTIYDFPQELYQLCRSHKIDFYSLHPGSDHTETA